MVLSTLKAETDALTKRIRKVFWIAGLFKELKQLISQLIILYNDSQNAITNVHDPANCNLFQLIFGVVVD